LWLPSGRCFSMSSFLNSSDSLAIAFIPFANFQLSQQVSCP
jgi:hypothetical protein